jgi:hypothetical protein
MPGFSSLFGRWSSQDFMLSPAFCARILAIVKNKVIAGITRKKTKAGEQDRMRRSAECTSGLSAHLFLQGVTARDAKSRRPPRPTMKTGQLSTSEWSSGDAEGMR